jgi:hypothetical protein
MQTALIIKHAIIIKTTIKSERKFLNRSILKIKRMSEFIDLQCGLTNDHIIEQPIGLSCGHCICKKCVPKQSKIRCKICGIETNKHYLETYMKIFYLNYLII